MTSVEKAEWIIAQNGDCKGIMCDPSDVNRCPCWREDGNHVCTSAGDDKGKCRKRSVEACEKYLLEHAVEEASKLPLYSDPVNHPNHYASSGIECIEAIKASMTEEAFWGYLKGNVQKYLWRYEKKVAPAEDLKKASWYLTRLIEGVDNGSKSN